MVAEADRARAAAADAEPRLAAAALLFVLSLAVTLAALALDTRQLHGESVWAKPIRFQVALAVYLGTLAWFARFLPAALTGRPLWRAYALVIAGAAIVEMLWIGGAAFQGTTSHFNVATPALERTYRIMGAVAVLLTSASLVVGVAIGLDRRSRLAPALRLSLALGLVLTFALTVLVAGTMAQQDGHSVGTPVTGRVVPLIGWSREVGDLRFAHFLATHAMHVVPLAGLAAAAVLPRRAAASAALAAAALFAALTLASFRRALEGLPPF
jgi:hypothetical protein